VSTFFDSSFLAASLALTFRVGNFSSDYLSSELANELRLKSSGLEDLQFPHAFPAPPVEPAIHNNVVNDGALSSWLYYLSETSLRRICDDVAWTLYKQPPTSWIKDVALMRAHAERLEGKIEAWCV
jgi:hypothetical protein